MRRNASLFGRSIHQLLIVFPLGLLAVSFAFDAAYMISGNPRFADVSFWLIASGVIGGLIAAVFGSIDFVGIPRGTRAKRIGAVHGLGNLAVVGLFSASWLLRYETIIPATGALVLSALGVALAVFTCWLGGELVDRMGAGVTEGARFDAPSAAR